MIFEQSFMALPEFLCGTPFERYEYEGTILTAFSMSILQELNSRNINNPISLLRSEVEYENTRKRADLFLDIQNLNLLNDDLKSYGFYEKNWLEAKFFRIGSNTQKPIVSQLKATFLLLKDFIRLCCLVSDGIQSDQSSNARYLLHAYQGDPKNFLTLERNNHGRRKERKWISGLLKHGDNIVVINDLNKETSKTFLDCIGSPNFPISIYAKVKNYIHKPRNTNTTGNRSYFIVLTRIDDFIIKIHPNQSNSNIIKGKMARIKGKIIVKSNHADFFRESKFAINDWLTD